MRDAFIRTLTESVATDRRIILITGDLGFGVLTEFARVFPAHYLNVGVAEQAMAGIAAGLALEGRTVLTYSIGNFPTLRCLEQIRNDICYHGANVKIVCIGGGMSYGQLGVTHHATEDIAIMRALPGMTVLVPGDIWEAEHATRRMLAHDGPCYLRLDKSAAATMPAAGESFHIGRFRTLQQGSDATIVATGGIVGEAVKAAALLHSRGISVRVLSAHTIKPLDERAIVDACRQTGGLLTLEEHNLDGGLGSAVAECCMDNGVTPRWFLRLGLKNDFPSLVGSQAYHRAAYGLDAASVMRAVQDKLKYTRSEVA